MGDDYNNRLNASVSETCLKAIDSTIEKSGIFNGRSDFLASAIRTILFRTASRLNIAELEAKKEGNSPLEIYTLYSNAVENYGDVLYDRYAHLYPGTNVKQIPIRIEKPLYENMVFLSKQLFRGSVSDAMVRMCRVALMQYIEDVLRGSTMLKQVKKHYVQLEQESGKNQIIINDGPLTDIGNPNTNPE